jgi:hypothetical protein
MIREDLVELKNWFEEERKKSKAKQAIVTDAGEGTGVCNSYPCLKVRKGLVPDLKKPGAVFTHLKNPLILFLNLEGLDVPDILPVLEHLAKMKRECFFITSSPPHGTEIIPTLVVNSLRGVLPSITVTLDDDTEIQEIANALNTGILGKNRMRFDERKCPSATLVASADSQTFIVNPLTTGGEPAQTIERVFVLSGGGETETDRAVKARFLNDR